MVGFDWNALKSYAPLEVVRELPPLEVMEENPPLEVMEEHPLLGVMECLQLNVFGLVVTL